MTKNVVFKYLNAFLYTRAKQYPERNRKKNPFLHWRLWKKEKNVCQEKSRAKQSKVNDRKKKSNLNNAIMEPANPFHSNDINARFAAQYGFAQYDSK